MKGSATLTIEEKLKQSIIFQYGSLRAFTMQKNLNYANIDSILRRGIKNATWTNVKALCTALEISADELANEKIIPIGESIERNKRISDIDKIIQIMKTNIKEYSDLNIDGKPVTANEIEMLLDGIDITVGIIKRNRKRNEDK